MLKIIVSKYIKMQSFTNKEKNKNKISIFNFRWSYCNRFVWKYMYPYFSTVAYFSCHCSPPYFYLSRRDPRKFKYWLEIFYFLFIIYLVEVRAFTMVLLNILAFSTLKSYFIYFITSLYNNQYQIFYIFFITSLKMI